MTRLEKIEHLIKTGHTYNPETGKIKSRFGNEIKSKNHSGYTSIYFSINNKKYMLRAHQFAWYWVYKKLVKILDHINGIRDDNRICNLRSVTDTENMYNKFNTKGYSYSKLKKKWRAQIRIKGKQTHIGYYDTEEDARNSYLKYKKMHHVIK